MSRPTPSSSAAAVHDAICRALDEAGVKNEVLRGMCLEVGLEKFAAHTTAPEAAGGWRTMESAPMTYPPENVLVYGPNLGTHIGTVLRYEDGTVLASVSHIAGCLHGLATHWMPLPPAPGEIAGARPTDEKTSAVPAVPSAGIGEWLAEAERRETLYSIALADWLTSKAARDTPANIEASKGAANAARAALLQHLRSHPGAEPAAPLQPVAQEPDYWGLLPKDALGGLVGHLWATEPNASDFDKAYPGLAPYAVVPLFTAPAAQAPAGVGAAPQEAVMLTDEESKQIFWRHIGHAWGYTKPQKDYAEAIQRAAFNKNGIRIKEPDGSASAGVRVCQQADAACVELPNDRRCPDCPVKLGGDNCDPRVKYADGVKGPEHG